MKFLLLLAILPLSYQDITEKQQEFCTRNDNGDIWKYDLTSLGLVDKPFMVSDTKWTYHLALCGETNIEISQDMKGDAIIQTNKDETHIVGTKITARHGGENWVNFILGAGDNYRHHCNGTQRKAQIMFICDPSAGQGKPSILDEANSDVDFCFYMFEWPTSLVCPKNAKGSSRGMSVFNLLLVEFVVIVIVYFVIGVGYKRYVVGARGYEQIPNLAFWKSCKEGMVATVEKCKGGSNSGIGGVRSDIITTPSTGTLNMNVNDDDERLIM